MIQPPGRGSTVILRTRRNRARVFLHLHARNARWNLCPSWAVEATFKFNHVTTLEPKIGSSTAKASREGAAAALEQVKAKNYDAPYRAKGLPIYVVGLSFDSKTRLLADAGACALH